MSNRIEKAASEVMGAVKATKAKIEGLTGVFEHLTREHGEVTALLLRVKVSSDAKVRAELFPKIRVELLSHEKGELAEVYPTFRERTELINFAEEHDRDAGTLEAAIEAVSNLPYEHRDWAMRFAELVDLVSAHVKREENEYFPAAQRALGADAAKEMLGRYEQAKARASVNPS